MWAIRLATSTEFGSSRWLLDVEGTGVRLFVSYIGRNEALPVAIDYSPRNHEKGTRGKSGRLLEVVRQQLTLQPTELNTVNLTEFTIPEEVTAEAVYQEGMVKQVIINAYERNGQARRACIAHHGASCSCCEFDFGKAYGPVGTGFIHVHHLRPLAEIGERYEVDSINDLRPVCPNCHAIIHRRTPPYSIKEVRAMLQDQLA